MYCVLLHCILSIVQYINDNSNPNLNTGNTTNFLCGKEVPRFFIVKQNSKVQISLQCDQNIIIGSHHAEYMTCHMATQSISGFWY